MSSSSTNETNCRQGSFQNGDNYSQRAPWASFWNLSKCDCYPSYDSNFHASDVKPGYTDVVDKIAGLNISSNISKVIKITVAFGKPCNFYEHANCVASFINKDGFDNDTEEGFQIDVRLIELSSNQINVIRILAN